MISKLDAYLLHAFNLNQKVILTLGNIQCLHIFTCFFLQILNGIAFDVTSRLVHKSILIHLHFHNTGIVIISALCYSLAHEFPRGTNLSLHDPSVGGLVFLKVKSSDPQTKLLQLPDLAQKKLEPNMSNGGKLHSLA